MPVTVLLPHVAGLGALGVTVPAGVAHWVAHAENAACLQRTVRCALLHSAAAVQQSLCLSMYGDRFPGALTRRSESHDADGVVLCRWQS